MVRSDYEESPRSSARRRRNSRTIPPPAPEVDWFVPVDEVPESPRRRRTDAGRDGSRHQDSDWERRPEDERLLRTPESRTSSSSYYHPRHRYHDFESRRDRSTTPSHSVASSMTSVLTPHPPRSSVTRQSTAGYRRPSVPLRRPPSADWDDEMSRESRRSHSQTRSIHVVPSAPLSRRSSRTLRSASVSSLDSDHHHDDDEDDDDDDDDEVVAYDNPNGRRRAPSLRETRIVRVERDERSRSRAGTERRSQYRQRRHEEPVSPDDEDLDEVDIRHPPPVDERPRDRTPSRPRPRSRARPASSVRHIREPENDAADDADSDEPPVPDPRDRLEHRTSRKHRHESRTPRDHRRNRSESHSKRSPPARSSKRYYESEAMTVEKRDRYHPPSRSTRRSNTVNGSGSVAASQHQSVSSSTKRSSNFLGSFFGSSLYGHSHHRAPGKPVKMVECVICMDDLPSHRATKLKCGHRMCNACLKRSFKLSITDPQHMPPKCCTADLIPLKHVERLFDINFKKTWNKKFVEYSARNRIYCPKRSCGEFIRPEDIRHTGDGKKFGRCARCGTKACVQCSGKWHRDRECPKDEETTRLLAQAKEEGWQRCMRCKALVELKEGCNHITCLCGAEFCYVCGAKWKTCDCPWFNYDTVEDDRLQHMQVPIPMRDRLGPRPAVDLPPSPQRESRPRLRARPQNYEEELLFRRQQEQRDEALARRLQDYRDFDDERDEDFLGGFGEITGIGNAAGHFLNDEFRPRPRNIAVPAPPPPHPHNVPLDPPPMFERVQAGDYVQDVSRARRPRANSLTRLAERFNTDLRSNPPQRPPPPMPTAVTMPPLSAMTPALAPGPTIRRGLVDPPSAGRILRPAAPVYEEAEDVSLPRGVSVRKQHVRDPPREVKESALAGLTGDGRYKNRVDEWRMHIGQGPGETAAEVVH